MYNLFEQVVAVIICDTGVALLAYMNHVDRATVFNVLMATLAATFAAVYKVISLKLTIIEVNTNFNQLCLLHNF